MALIELEATRVVFKLLIINPVVQGLHCNWKTTATAIVTLTCFYMYFLQYPITARDLDKLDIIGVVCVLELEHARCRTARDVGAIDLLAPSLASPPSILVPDYNFVTQDSLKLLTSQQQPKWVVVQRSIRSASAPPRTGSWTNCPVRSTSALLPQLQPRRKLDIETWTDILQVPMLPRLPPVLTSSATRCL
jgi:hypothetical protein